MPESASSTTRNSNSPEPRRGRVTERAEDPDGSSCSHSSSLHDLAHHDLSRSVSQVALPVLRFLLQTAASKINLRAVSTLLVATGSLSWAYPHNGFLLVLFGMLCCVCLFVPGLMIVTLWPILSKSFARSRMPAFATARGVLLDRLRTGRAQRIQDCYDLYLPPPAPGAATTTSPNVGLLWFPGALVNHTAYAPFAARLSDRGVPVAVVSLEPNRYATAAGPSLERAQEAIEALSETTKVEAWALGGHALGALLAMALVSELKPARLVLCGIATTGPVDVPDLSGAPIHAVVMNGSEDAIVNKHSDADREAFASLLPPASLNGGVSRGRTNFVTIEGGNHAGFGHYGPQTKPMKDGERTIELEEQQKILLDTTSAWLLGNPSKEADARKKNE